MLREFPSGSGVVIFSDHKSTNRTGLSAFVFVKQSWSDRKWVWGQEVAYFQRQKELLRRT